MKRKIALLILTILALSLALAACQQTAATEIYPRWEAEKHVFNITLADFASASTDTFNKYTKEGIVDIYNGNYFKDIGFSNEFVGWDEIRPLDVRGTYTLTITPSEDGSSYCDVTTTQVVYVKYYLKSDTHSGVDYETYPELHQVDADPTEYEPLGLTTTGATTILKSTTDTAVRFTNLPTQKPLSSSTSVNGFYIGETNQNRDKYDIATEYDYSDTSYPVAKITLDGKTTEHKFSKKSEGTFIDSNQIIMYLRSLDKSNAAFKDSPSKSVFIPYSQKTLTARFGISRDYNVILTKDDKPVATHLDIVSVTVGNNAFMMQENLGTKFAESKLDVVKDISNKSKFTTVRFRVGYLAYEIAYDSEQNLTDGQRTNWDAIWDVLCPAPEPDPDPTPQE